MKQSYTETGNTKTTVPSRVEVWKMFDRIAHRYDLLNRLLSFGTDIVWRNKTAALLNNPTIQGIPGGLKVLDLATGTGDLAITICNKNNNISGTVGMDMSGEMLKIGKKKVIAGGLSGTVTMVKGNATEIPFGSRSFHAVTIAFGIRNVTDVLKSLKDMHRILHKGGRVLILEFSLPANKIIRSAYLFYFRKILPALGSIISGDGYAYKYLNETVETFPYGKTFNDLLIKAGFVNVEAFPLTFGIASIYRGDKI